MCKEEHTGQNNSKADSLFVRLESGSNVGNVLTLRTRASEEARRMFKAPNVVSLFTTGRPCVCIDRHWHATGGKAHPVGLWWHLLMRQTHTAHNFGPLPLSTALEPIRGLHRISRCHPRHADDAADKLVLVADERDGGQRKL
eukprot:2463850-Prymnesium_polylepis.1